jgi:hypothetical protein
VPDSTRVELQVGDRVKMSVLGSERSPLLVRKVGTVTCLALHRVDNRSAIDRKAVSRAPLEGVAFELRCWSKPQCGLYRLLF